MTTRQESMVRRTLVALALGTLMFQGTAFADSASRQTSNTEVRRMMTDEVVPGTWAILTTDDAGAATTTGLDSLPAESEAQTSGADNRCEAPAGSSQPWPTARPAEVDLDPAKLREAVEFAAVRQSATFQVFRHGCLVASGPFDPAVGPVKRNLWSATKTVNALVTGRAITLGYLKLDDTVGRWFPVADVPHAAIRVRDLLTMTSGLHMEWDVELNVAQPDRVKLALSLPVEHQPGTYFEYHQTAGTLLTALVERAVGRDYQDFVQAELFGPVGISRASWLWQRDRAGNTEGWSQLYMEPNDNLARLGALMLHEGRFRDRQLIDAGYMRELARGTEANPGYGFLTWLNGAERYWTAGFPHRTMRQHRPFQSAPADMFLAWGLHGQHVFVIPSLDMVITRTHQWHDLGSPDTQPDFSAAGGDSGEGYHELFRRLMAAVTDQRIPDPGPYREPLDHRADPALFVNEPLIALGAAGLGREAPAGCTAAGCDGSMNDGTIRNFQDVVTTAKP